jgi:hypothetical protein
MGRFGGVHRKQQQPASVDFQVRRHVNLQEINERLQHAGCRAAASHVMGRFGGVLSLLLSIFVNLQEINLPDLSQYVAATRP